MRKFVSPVMIKWIKVATLLLVFVLLLHSSRDGKYKDAESKALFGVTEKAGVSGSEVLQVDESVGTDAGGAYSYVLPVIVIGSARLRF